MPETVTTFCRICEVLCGLEADVDGDTVVDLRPDPAHVATAGFACPKGLKQHKLYDSPDRLLYPEKREGEAFGRGSSASASSPRMARCSSPRRGPPGGELVRHRIAPFDATHLPPPSRLPPSRTLSSPLLYSAASKASSWASSKLDIS